MDKSNPTSAQSDELFDNQQYLTSNKVASLLGITRDYFYVLSNRRNIPKLHLSKRCVRYKWSEVLAALQKGDRENGI